MAFGTSKAIRDAAVSQAAFCQIPKWQPMRSGRLRLAESGR